MSNPRMETLAKFRPEQIEIVNKAVALAEELVSNYYKMSASQWLHRRYDIKTLTDLAPDEVVSGPFAQIVRYEGRHRDRALGSSTYDLYKICLQDHAILAVLEQKPDLNLLPFVLYIVTHELIHIVRFSRFLQYFDAAPDERLAEEKRVHLKTHEILAPCRVPGLGDVLEFYNEWRIPYDDMKGS
ncbi:MAG: hypothetical protein WAK95_05510 [Desulfobacterales bacterium]